MSLDSTGSDDSSEKLPEPAQPSPQEDYGRLKCLTTHRGTRIAEFLRFVGPGLLVTVGFIDPGNWATNVAAGAQFGTSLLWVVSLSTLMLIMLQHNVAHLGIVSGLCLSESIARHFPRPVSVFVLSTAVMAGIATLPAELLGAAIGLRMLCGLPLLQSHFAGSELVQCLISSHSVTASSRTACIKELAIRVDTERASKVSSGILIA